MKIKILKEFSLKLNEQVIEIFAFVKYKKRP